MTSIDLVDRRIISQIQRDASLSIGEIAERVGASPSSCWRRIQKLEKSGVITRRVALADPEKLGLPLSVFVSVRTSRHNIDWLEDFAKAVAAMPEVIGFYRLAGEIDYLLHVVLPDIGALDAFYKKLVSNADLSNVSSHLVMERIKHTTELPV